MNVISGFQSALSGIHKGMNALAKDAQVIASQGATEATSDSPLNAASPLEKDVTSAIVDLKSSTHQVEASAKVIKAQDEMLGSLLDEMA